MVDKLPAAWRELFLILISAISSTTLPPLISGGFSALSWALLADGAEAGLVALAGWLLLWATALTRAYGVGGRHAAGE